ncbi:MAG: hypothetical protein M9882_02530 [Homoserinimonas sp.]|nr:hypothetical protein [Homoserinimonas sp.]
MIDWLSFVVVATASLIGACLVVVIASLGIRLYERGIQARAENPDSGKVKIALSRLLFGISGILALFGVYLIVPIFH